MKGRRGNEGWESRESIRNGGWASRRNEGSGSEG